MHCPPAEDLVAHLFDSSAMRSPTAVNAHVVSCASCTQAVAALYAMGAAIRDGQAVKPVGSQCLGEVELSAILDGVAGRERVSHLAHIAACAACRGRLSTVQRIISDDLVRAEMGQVERRDRFPRLRTSPRLVAAGALAAALLLTVALRENTQEDASGLLPDRPLHREVSITTTVAPRILQPEQPATRAGVLVWSSVPHADRYRIVMFDAVGQVALDEYTVDTTFVLPRVLRVGNQRQYLWKVEAKTGWDRWVSSEWSELAVGDDSSR